MLYENDIELVENAVLLGYRSQDSGNAWDRIKHELKELAQQPTNTGSPKLLSLCKRAVMHADMGVDIPYGHPIIDEMREQLTSSC